MRLALSSQMKDLMHGYCDSTSHQMHLFVLPKTNNIKYNQPALLLHSRGFLSVRLRGRAAEH